MDKWLLSIEADPAWVRGKLNEVKTLALPLDGLQFLPEGETIEGELMPGYEGPEHEGQELVAAGEGPLLDYGAACQVKNAEGEPYVNFDSEQLLIMWGKLKKSLNLPNLTDDQIEERSYKMAAILAIVGARQQEQEQEDK